MPEIDRERLRALIKEQRTTPRALSRKVGGNDSLLRDILSGKVRNARSDTITKIAQELKVPPGDFMRGEVIDGAFPSRNMQLVPQFLAVRYRVKAGLWQEVEFEEPPEDFAFAVLPHPRYAQWPQWLERVEGESANKKVPDGHFIHVVDALEMGYTPRTDDWVVVERLRDQGAVRERSLKQVEILASGNIRLWPRSTNQRWSLPLDLREGGRTGEEGIEARIVGLVIGSYNPHF